MPQDSTKNEINKFGRFLRVFAPFFILLAILALVNYGISSLEPPQQSVAETAGAIVEEPTATEARQSPETGERPYAIATAIPNATVSISPTPEPTQTPIATWTPGEVASLSGPPPSSAFSADTTLSFYWQGGRPLPEGYRYGLYIVGDDLDVLVAELSKPNLGSVYAVHLAPEDFDLTDGEYVWQVRVIQQSGDAELGVSEQRPIHLSGARS